MIDLLSVDFSNYVKVEKLSNKIFRAVFPLQFKSVLIIC